MFIIEFIHGLRAYATANQVILKHRLWPYLIVPGVLSLVIIMIIITGGTIYFDDLSQYISTNWLPGFMNHPAMTFVTAFLLWILLLIIGFMAYKHIVLVLFSPVLGQLSEKTGELVFNDPPPAFSIKTMLADLHRSVIINVRNILLTLLLTAIAWSFIFIPLIGTLISTALIFLIQAYYGGFGLIDCVLERKRYSVRQSVDFAKNHRGRLIGVGTGFMLLLAIPIVGWFVAPAYGAVAATLATLKKIQST